MKRLSVLAAVLVFAVSMLLAGVGLADAYSINSGTNVNLSQEGKIEDTVFAAGQTIIISADVDGDIFCAGQTITVSGNVTGDVICAGQTVTVTGEITGDVRLAGQTVSLEGAVSGNATIGAQSFTLGSGGSVGGDISLGSTDGYIYGSVGRDIIAGNDKLVVAGGVGRNIKAATAELKLTDKADVKGSIDYTSAQEAVIADGAQVSGEITRSEPTQKQGTDFEATDLLGFGISLFIYTLLAMLLIAMLLVLLLPGVVHTVSQQAVDSPWKSLLVGLAVSILMPIVLVFIAFTVVGIPLAILVGLAWLLIIFVSGPMSAYYLGRMLLKQSTNSVLIMLTGALALIVAYFIPFIGAIVLAGALWLGSGMILLDLFGRTPKPVYEIPAPSKVSKKR